jgi:hypothetical protein
MLPKFWQSRGHVFSIMFVGKVSDLDCTCVQGGKSAFSFGFYFEALHAVKANHNALKQLHKHPSTTD